MPGWTMTRTVEQDQGSASAEGYAIWMIKRTDRMTAFHVDLAINLAGSHGVAAGAREMFRLGLPFELAHRVLLKPRRRRGASVTLRREA